MEAGQVGHRSRVVATRLPLRYQHGDMPGQTGVGGAAALGREPTARRKPSSSSPFEGHKRSGISFGGQGNGRRTALPILVEPCLPATYLPKAIKLILPRMPKIRDSAGKPNAGKATGNRRPWCWALPDRRHICIPSNPVAACISRRTKWPHPATCAVRHGHRQSRRC